MQGKGEPASERKRGLMKERKVRVDGKLWRRKRSDTAICANGRKRRTSPSEFLTPSPFIKFTCHFFH